MCQHTTEIAQLKLELKQLQAEFEKLKKQLEAFQSVVEFPDGNDSIFSATPQPPPLETPPPTLLHSNPPLFPQGQGQR